MDSKEDLTLPATESRRARRRRKRHERVLAGQWPDRAPEGPHSRAARGGPGASRAAVIVSLLASLGGRP